MKFQNQTCMLFKIKYLVAWIRENKRISLEIGERISIISKNEVITKEKSLKETFYRNYGLEKIIIMVKLRSLANVKGLRVMGVSLYL